MALAFLKTVFTYDDEFWTYALYFNENQWFDIFNIKPEYWDYHSVESPSMIRLYDSSTYRQKLYRWNTAFSNKTDLREWLEIETSRCRVCFARSPDISFDKEREYAAVFIFGRSDDAMKFKLTWL